MYDLNVENLSRTAFSKFYLQYECPIYVLADHISNLITSFRVILVLQYNDIKDLLKMLLAKRRNPLSPHPYFPLFQLR